MPGGTPTDPDEQISCIRFVRSWFRYKSAIRCCFVNTFIRSLCIGRVSQHRLHNPASPFPSCKVTGGSPKFPGNPCASCRALGPRSILHARHCGVWVLSSRVFGRIPRLRRVGLTDLRQTVFMPILTVASPRPRSRDLVHGILRIQHAGSRAFSCYADSPRS